jgi:hypothetical protein
MVEVTARVGPGVCVGVGTVVLCCAMPGVIGTFVAGGAIALSDGMLTVAGVAMAGLGLILWFTRRGPKRGTSRVQDSTRRLGVG